MFRSIFSPWVIGGAILIALLLIVSTIGLLWLSRPVPAPGGAATAVLNVIRVPTSTPIPFVSTEDIEPLPTQTVQSDSSGEVRIGSTVRVIGTSGAGLRFRQQPGLSQGVRFLAKEEEEFVVKDGPQQIDGYTWWYLVNPEDETRWGWAVTDYLEATGN